MNSDQLHSLAVLAHQGYRAAISSNHDLAMFYQCRLDGWWECALSAGDMDLACAAYRAESWVRAASAFFVFRQPCPVTVNGAGLMWREQS
ncbi:MAG TPA: hypothetical protein DIU19_10970 [Alcanivorax sp.]|nr:hypothetical protein [Alcanivorax sp.]MQG78527.1 hypothetical protein [SAR202 cluster bacterium]MBF47749.1 hypothetical protein [Alcanivorax sp.]HBP92964.1 hypothetical protein [Alcanivorax sp.]HCD74607.1 hypothetical protein [Alcanivorax sp.]